MNGSPLQPIPVILDIDEAARVLRCGPETVRGYLHRRQLRGIQIGRPTRIRGCDFLRFIEE